MWKMAEIHGVDGVRDLTDLQYDQCLRDVHKYFTFHPGQCHEGKVKIVEKGKGPSHRGERAQKGPEEITHEKECYNGLNGGRVYKYYTPGTFARILHQSFALTWDKISERQCMDALRATSEELGIYPQTNSQLLPYAGPQCFPQLYDDSRRLANGRVGQEEQVEAPLDMRRERQFMEKCWLRCDACRKWRLVEPDALASLTAMKYKEITQCAEDVDWKGWLGQARARYDVFLQEHEK